MTPNRVIGIPKSRLKIKFIDNQNQTYDMQLIDPISGQNAVVKQQVPIPVIIRFLEESIAKIKWSRGKE